VWVILYLVRPNSRLLRTDILSVDGVVLYRIVQRSSKFAHPFSKRRSFTNIYSNAIKVGIECSLSCKIKPLTWIIRLPTEDNPKTLGSEISLTSPRPISKQIWKATFSLWPGMPRHQATVSGCSCEMSLVHAGIIVAAGSGLCMDRSRLSCG
jgi:hypothetical protein